MIPEPLTNEPCGLAVRWGISKQLAVKLRLGAEKIERAGLGVPIIIEGFRTREQHDDLTRRGRPTAPYELSTHTTCPATGADYWLSSFTDGPESDGAKLAATLIWESVGLRVGGGSRKLANGLYEDFNHLDLGPRP